MISRFFLGALCCLLAAAALSTSTTEDDNDALSSNNWENTVICHPANASCPSTYEQVADLVRVHQRVRVKGKGHSYNQFLCSEDLMITTTCLNQVISVDPVARTVTTQAGVTTRDLLDYLGQRGYSLATYSFFIDQTIAGAVITGTHGSSIRYGGLSNQVRQVKMVLADGSIRTFTQSDGDFMRAARVSVGLLGVVVELTLDIVEDQVVERSSELVSQYVMLEDAQRAIQDPLTVDRLQYFFFPAPKSVLRVQVTDAPHDAMAQPDVGRFASDLYMSTINERHLEHLVLHVVGSIAHHPNTQKAVKFLLANLILFSAHPGYRYLSRAFPVQQLAMTAILLNVFGQYDQYEFAVALDKAPACLTAFLNFTDNDPTFFDDFRVSPLIRYVGKEDALLSLVHDGPRLFFNIDNYDAYRKEGGYSRSFEEVKRLMSSDVCQARLHFGKAGWSARAGGRWNSNDAMYEKKALGDETWRRFMEVAQTLDPSGKFADSQHLFTG